jgi:FkbM family methyltransferase
MGKLHDIRMFVRRRMHIDVTRFPGDYERRRAKMLSSNNIDLVLDVGAAVGSYGESLRDCGYRGRIESFEPLVLPYHALAELSRADDLWVAHNVAVGAEPGRIAVNVAGNSDSSSVLRMLDTHVEAVPYAAFTGETQIANLVTIDEVLRQDEAHRPFLKIDVQGYEREVLEGATRSLGRIVGVQIELSGVELYDGQMLIDETIDWLQELGFVWWGFEPAFCDPKTGRELQVDGLFFR